MRVVHLASGDLWAGAEVLLFTLCKALNRFDSLTVKIILLNEGELAERLRTAGLEVVVFDESKLNIFQVYARVHRQLKKWRPDLLHTHRQKENIIGAIAAKLSGIKSIRTVHGAPEHHFGWRKPHKSFLVSLDKWGGRYLQQKIVSVSKELTTKLTPLFSAEKVVTVENGVDLELLKPYEKDKDTLFDKNPIQIGLVGRLVPVKRIDRFIESAKILVNNCKTVDFQFNIYGDGPLKGELLHKIKSARLEKQVHLKGHRDNIYECIRDLDLLLITSEHEGLPITLLEAMAIGTPVISTNIGSIVHVLAKESCGTLVDGSSASSIVKAIELCLANKVNTIEKTEKAKLRVNNNYSAKRNACDYVRVYKSL